MVTGGFLIVLFAVFPAVAASSFTDNAKLPICQKSAVYLVMTDLNHCTTDREASNPLPQASFTVADIVRLAQDYYTFAVRNRLFRFQDKIRECNAIFQAKVSQLAERGVGLLCQPGGAGVNPTVSAVLDGIDDKDIDLLRTNNGSCPGIRTTIYRCRTQLPDLFETARLSLDELVALTQGIASNYTTCSFRAHKMVKDMCSYWRLAFLSDTRYLQSTVLPGVEMPEELARELEM